MQTWEMLNDEYIMSGVTAKPGFPHPNSTTQGVVVKKWHVWETVFGASRVCNSFTCSSFKLQYDLEKTKGECLLINYHLNRYSHIMTSYDNWNSYINQEVRCILDHPPPPTMTQCFRWLQFGTNGHGKYDIRLIILRLDHLAPVKACKSYVKLLQIIFDMCDIHRYTVSKIETKHAVIKSSHQFPVFSPSQPGAIWTEIHAFLPRQMCQKFRTAIDTDQLLWWRSESLGVRKPLLQNPWKFQVLRFMDKIRLTTKDR